MIPRWRSAATVLLLASASLQGAEYSEAVPLDLLQPLLGGGRVLQELPPGFPLTSLPPGLSVIGSIDQAPAAQRVLLRSQQDGAAAADLLRASFLAAGWRPAPPQSPPPLSGIGLPPGVAPWVSERPPVFPPSLGIRGLPPVETGLDRSLPEVGIRGVPLSGGLISGGTYTSVAVDLSTTTWVRDLGDVGVYPGQSPTEIQLCGEAGLLTLRGESGRENRVYLQLQPESPSVDPSPCALTGDPQQPVSPRPSLLDHLPELHAGQALTAPPPSLPSRGLALYSSTEFSHYWYSSLSNARALDMDVEYAPQLLAQGWEQDAEWSSPDAAGSNWLRLSEDGLRLYLSLVVEEVSDDVFITQVSLRSLP